MQGGQMTLLAAYSALALCLSLSTADRLLAQSYSRTNASDGTGAYSKIDTYVEQSLIRLKVPGAELAIVEGDKIVHFRSFGSMDRKGTPPSAQTPSFVGSLTKCCCHPV